MRPFFVYWALVWAGISIGWAVDAAIAGHAWAVLGFAALAGLQFWTVRNAKVTS